MVCYGCGGNFYENETLEGPNNLIVISKTQSVCADKAAKEDTRSSDMPKVYYHFNYNCLSHRKKTLNVAFIKFQNDPLSSV